jgi:hypothetical protein
MDLDLQALGETLFFRRIIESLRRSYLVFEGKSAYLLISRRLESTKKQLSKDSSAVVVQKHSVEYVRKKFAGDTWITSAKVVTKSRRTNHAQDQFAALHILYVLTAIGEADMSQGISRSLRFSINGEAAPNPRVQRPRGQRAARR